MPAGIGYRNQGNDISEYAVQAHCPIRSQIDDTVIPIVKPEHLTEKKFLTCS